MIVGAQELNQLGIPLICFRQSLNTCPDILRLHALSQAQKLFRILQLKLPEGERLLSRGQLCSPRLPVEQWIKVPGLGIRSDFIPFGRVD